MPDRLSQLPLFESPLADSDILAVSQDMGGTPETRQMRYDELVLELSNIFAGTSTDLFLENTASDIGGYKSLTSTVPAGAEVTDAASIAAADTVVNEYAAIADLFNFIGAQVIHAHLHLAKTAGTKLVNAYVKIFHRTSGGTETLMGTSSVHTTIESVATVHEFDVAVSDTPFSSTDRIVLKLYGTPVGAGTNPTLTVYFQGTTNSRIGFNGAGAGGTTGSAGAVIQSAHTETGAVLTGTTTIPADDTIPQNTEGTEFMTVTITPTAAANYLLVEVEILCSYSVIAEMVAALFRDTTANALAATSVTIRGANDLHKLQISKRVAAGSTSATTFKARAGGAAAGTISVNGSAATRRFGGVAASSIRVFEIIP